MHPVKRQLEALLAVLMVTIASSFPTGAPQSACGHLLPLHEDTQPQMSPPPFLIILSSSNYTSHKPIQVKVKGLESFLAFMLQGRTLSGDPVGRFSQPPPHARLQTCYDTKDDTLSHTSAFEREEIDFIWHPPEEDHGDIIITGSIARTKYIFWAVKSVNIHGKTRGDGGLGGGASQCTPPSILITTLSLLLYLSSLLSHHTSA